MGVLCTWRRNSASVTGTTTESVKAETVAVRGDS